jgi:hypothetical protein
MSETEQYLRMLLQQQGIVINEHSEPLFHDFVRKEENINKVKSIRGLQVSMTQHWQLIARREEISRIHFAFPNGIVGKPYEAEFNLHTYGLDDVSSYNFSGLEGSGLTYQSETNRIEGIPIISGDILLIFNYSLNGAENQEENQKKISIIINPDPKSLWKDLPSNAEGPYAKPDNTHETTSFLGHTLIASSKRGRSHANKGSFRDDDYAYATLNNGWGIIAISDGAGSATYSRQGSLLACQAVIDYFTANPIDEEKLLEEAISAYPNDKSIKTKLLDIAFQKLSVAAKKAHTTIEDFAASTNTTLADFHATLAFVLVKQFPTGYAFLSFAVGDCPMVLIDQSFEWVKPLNVLDVGEYGGGTRFVTMPDIFNKENFRDRFNFEFTTECPYLVLMTDGIYDPKFEVEANLANPIKWKSFFDDLQGNNEQQINVLLESETEKGDQLSGWMDFWSPGNHDDRTLIVLF